jgi:hypothetical protein
LRSSSSADFTGSHDAGLASVNVSDALASVLDEGQPTTPYWIQTLLITTYFVMLLVLYLRDKEAA